MPMKLYAHQNNYKTQKALVAAKYAGLEIEAPKGAGDAQTGKIPVLETDQGCIFTSIAIARYLSRIRRDVGLYGQNLIEGGMIDSWVEFCTHELEIPLCTWVFPLKGIFPEVPEATAQAKEDVKRALDVLNKHLLSNTFMVGHQVTLADICICCALSDAMSLAFDEQYLAPLGNLMRWYNLCSVQPEFEEVLGKAKGSAKAAGGAPAKKAEAKKAAAPAAKKESKPAAAPAAAASSGGGSDAEVKEVGDAIRALKEKLKGEGLSGKKVNENEEVKALVAKMNELKGSSDKAPAAAPAPKAKAEKAEKKAPAPKADAPPAKKEESPEEARKKKMKKVMKEGGKRGVEIEGAADMGGLQFFCTNVEEPEGDLEMMEACMTAMNEKSDPTEEERKGGSGNIGKMIFSCCTEHLGVLAYVPEHQREACSCEEWIKKTLGLFGGVVIKSGKDVCIGKVVADGNNNIFPLKIREPMILEANNFLRKLGLFPEDNGDSDDDMVFGDDDFPSM